MNCGDKPNRRCNTVEAACVKYDKEVPTFSSLVDDDCKSIEETTEDIYSILETIKEDIDLASVTSDCGTLPTQKTTIAFIQWMINKICALEEITTEQASTIETMQQQIEDLQTNNCN